METETATCFIVKATDPCIRGMGMEYVETRLRERQRDRETEIERQR